MLPAAGRVGPAFVPGAAPCRRLPDFRSMSLALLHVSAHKVGTELAKPNIMLIKYLFFGGRDN